MKLSAFWFNMKVFAASIMTFVLLSGIAQATPSTTYWTPLTPDIQAFGVLHLGIDNYATVGKGPNNGAGSLPTDAGLTIGILPFEKLQMEVGIDYLAPQNWVGAEDVSGFAYNAKLGSPEGVLFKESPALYIGFFGGGFSHKSVANNLTGMDTWYGTIGKTIPYIGRLSVGAYMGNDRTLVNGLGEKENTGWLVAYDRGFLPVMVKDKDGKEEVDYNRIVMAADYASGKNLIGGGGVGLYYFFTKDVSLLTGPVWFNDEVVNGAWKWTTQLDINVDIFSKFSKK